MAGALFIIDSNGNRVLMDFRYGEAIINGRVWRWTFHDYLGPLFVRKDGEPLKCQYPTNKAVWAAFEAWLKEYQKS